MKRRIIIALLSLMLLIPFTAKAIEDHPLKTLKIEGFGVDLDPTAQTQKGYWCGKKTIKIIAEPTNENYKVTGAGNVTVEDGENELKVVVTDPDDESSYTYTINLNVNGESCGKTATTTTTTGFDNPETGVFITTGKLILFLAVAMIGYDFATRNRKFK